MQKTAEGSVTSYAGNYVYSGNTTTETLQFLSQPEGYATPYGMGGYDYVYQYKDHLGNIRLSYVDNNGTLEIVEENNYYPFGLKHKGYNNVTSSYGNSVAQKWKYNGVELDETTGLYEMDFRQYDAAIGRFIAIDPLANERDWLSPYNFVQNNPILRIDPSGLLDDYGIDVDGNVSLLRKTDDDTDTLYFVDKDWDIVEDDIDDIPNKGSVTVNKNKDGSSILSQLANNNETESTMNSDGATSDRTASIAVSENADDIFNVFKFAADVTNVEFNVQKFGLNGKINYQLGTFHKSDISPGLRGDGIGLGSVHSHPNVAITNSGVPTKSDRINSTAGDRDRGTNYLKRNGKNLPYLIYFPSNGSTSRIQLPKEDFLIGTHVRLKNNVGGFKF